MIAGILAVSLAAPAPACATGRQDISIALKTLPLLTAKMPNPAAVAIIYDPADARSQTDAEGIKAIIDSGAEAPGDIGLAARLVSTGELVKLAGAKIAFLAAALPRADFAAIGAAAAQAGALTISTDLDCVKSNDCVLGVVSMPQVEIYYSPAAASRARINFASAFTMLAKQSGAM